MAGGTGAETEMGQLGKNTAADEVATMALVDATKTGCNVDLA